MKTIESSGTLSRNSFLRSLVFGVPLLSAPALLAQNDLPAGPVSQPPDLGNLRAFVELARSDVRTQKALVIAQNIQFTDDESVEFWPLHKEYETELNKLLDLRYAGIDEFVRSAAHMTDPQANDLARKAFDLESKRTDLKRKYFRKFKQVIPAVKAARFFQIENQINMAIDLQIAASLPLIK